MSDRYLQLQPEEPSTGTCAAQKPSVPVRLEHRQPASDWTITDNSSADLRAISFHVIHWNITPQGSSSWRDSVEALMLVVILTNEWNIPQKPPVPISPYVTALSRSSSWTWCGLPLDFCGACHFYGIWQLMYFTEIEWHCSVLLLYRLIKISYSQILSPYWCVK